MNDSFGTPIGEGDLIASIAHSTGRAKIGRVIRNSSGNLAMSLLLESFGTKVYAPDKRTGPIGSGVVVLEFADGTVPDPLAVLYG